MFLFTNYFPTVLSGFLGKSLGASTLEYFLNCFHQECAFDMNLQCSYFFILWFILSSNLGACKLDSFQMELKCEVCPWTPPCPPTTVGLPGRRTWPELVCSKTTESHGRYSVCRTNCTDPLLPHLFLQSKPPSIHHPSYWHQSCSLQQ